MPLLKAILAKPDESADFLCNPFVVREGITFLHGDTSIGKSPLTWELARCVAQGLPFLGLPTRPARVLYLEADTAEAAIRPRLRLLPVPNGEEAWHMEFLGTVPMNLCDHEHRMFNIFKEFRRKYGDFDLIIWNTLRQFYQGSAVDSEVPAKVYKGLRLAFPGAAHWVNAHDRKQSTDPNAVPNEREAFSGSKAWLDLATIALALTRHGAPGAHWLRLTHTKSQVSAQIEPIDLILDRNGTSIYLKHENQLAKIRAAMGSAESQGLSRTQCVKFTAATLGLSERTIWGVLAVDKSSAESSTLLPSDPSTANPIV